MNDIQKTSLKSDLEELRHILLNATLAIEASLRKIERTVAYMTEALKIFEKLVEKIK